MTRLTRREIRPSGLKSNYFPFEGGINMVDPALSMRPGELVAANNFEVDVRGRYRRLDGYERFDGQTLPSDITIYRIPLPLDMLEILYLMRPLVPLLTCKFRQWGIW